MEYGNNIGCFCYGYGIREIVAMQRESWMNNFVVFSWDIYCIMYEFTYTYVSEAPEAFPGWFSVFFLISENAVEYRKYIVCFNY